MEIVDLLRNIDLPTLRAFAGETIIAAIEAVAPARYERELCEILRLKYGSDILEQRNIRFAIIDGLTKQQAEDFAHRVGGSTADGAAWASLQNYFRPWKESRSQEFVTYFGLSENFTHKPVIDDRTAKVISTAKHGETVTLKGVLHAYQKRVKDAMTEQMTLQGFRGIVQMPTGAGKTLTALEAAVDLFRAPTHEGFVVWIVDSNELAEQAFEAFSDLWRLKGDRPLALYRLFKNFAPSFEDEHSGMVFTSFAKLHPALEQGHPLNRSAWHLVRNSKLLIVDEAHTSVAPTHEECIRAFINTDACAVIGLTATPGRSLPLETADLARLYTTSLIGLTDETGSRVPDPIGYLQDRQYLAKLRIEVFETGAKAQGLENQVCATLAKDSARNKLIIEQIKLAENAAQPTLVFAATLDHVFALQILCSAYEIKVQVITGATPQPTRIEILERFRRREFYILLNLDLLSTGIDLPNVEKIIITRPVGSPILYSQILGRALRGPLNGGRLENTIITLRDNIVNFPSANLVYNYFSEDWNAPPQFD